MAQEGKKLITLDHVQKVILNALYTLELLCTTPEQYAVDVPHWPTEYVLLHLTKNQFPRVLPAFP